METLSPRQVFQTAASRLPPRQPIIGNSADSAGRVGTITHHPDPSARSDSQRSICSPDLSDHLNYASWMASLCPYATTKS